jgi:hypothetical protein
MRVFRKTGIRLKSAPMDDLAQRTHVGEIYELRTIADAVMVAYLAPPRTSEERFCIIRAGLSLVAEMLGFLVEDPTQRTDGAQYLESASLRLLLSD